MFNWGAGKRKRGDDDVGGVVSRRRALWQREDIGEPLPAITAEGEERWSPPPVGMPTFSEYFSIWEAERFSTFAFPPLPPPPPATETIDVDMDYDDYEDDDDDRAAAAEAAAAAAAEEMAGWVFTGVPNPRQTLELAYDYDRFSDHNYTLERGVSPLEPTPQHLCDMSTLRMLAIGVIPRVARAYAVAGGGGFVGPFRLIRVLQELDVDNSRARRQINSPRVTLTMLLAVFNFFRRRLTICGSSGSRNIARPAGEIEVAVEDVLSRSECRRFVAAYPAVERWIAEDMVSIYRKARTCEWDVFGKGWGDELARAENVWREVLTGTAETVMSMTTIAIDGAPTVSRCLLHLYRRADYDGVGG